MSVEMAKAIKEGNQTALATATDELVQKMTRKDMANAAVKDLFSGKAKFGLDQASVQNLSEHFSRAVIAENPTLTPSIIPKLDKKSLDNFSDTYERELNDALRIATPGSPAHDQLTKSKDQFQKILANYALGFTPTEGGAPAATPAPAPTPSPAPGPATP